jgi:small subunit ribosomal protein S8e
MAFWHGEKGKRKTGGEIALARGKRKHELGSSPTHTEIGEQDKRKIHEGKAGNTKVRAVSAQFANVLDPKTKTTKKVKILDIVENKANPHYVRRLIITKGSIIKTEEGNARVVSRPSQHGIVNAIKIE